MMRNTSIQALTSLLPKQQQDILNSDTIGVESLLSKNEIVMSKAEKLRELYRLKRYPHATLMTFPMEVSAICGIDPERAFVERSSSFEDLCHDSYIHSILFKKSLVGGGERMRFTISFRMFDTDKGCKQAGAFYEYSFHIDAFDFNRRMAEALCHAFLDFYLDRKVYKHHGVGSFSIKKKGDKDKAKEISQSGAYTEMMFLLAEECSSFFIMGSDAILFNHVPQESEGTALIIKPDHT